MVSNVAVLVTSRSTIFDVLKVTQILIFDLKMELTTEMVVLLCGGEVQQKD